MQILRSKTRDEWLGIALERFDLTLLDHAHCEKKAAASAMSLVSAYPEHSLLVRRMVKLAREELQHFQQVHEHIVARGLVLGRDSGDRYAQKLHKLMRTPAHQRLIDRLLVGALIEARSHERLALLAEGLPPDDQTLSKFYAGLAVAEAGHFRLFVRLAAHYSDEETSTQRLNELADAEAEIVASLPLEARIH